MKQLFFLPICLILLLTVSCSGWDPSRGWDPSGCYQTVCAKYPEAEINRLPGFDYHFIVRTKKGDIRIVETMSFFSIEITDDLLLLKGRK